MKTFTATVPTYKREKDLAACLDSILSQSRLPTEVLVIDDDVLPAPYLADWKRRFEERGVAFVYHRKDHAVHRRGLSESKNLALKLATGEIIFYFDDDVVLGAGFLKEIMSVWESSSDDKLLGVGGLIEGERVPNGLERVYNRLFGLTSEHAWDINDVGFQVWDWGLRETAKGYYLPGGVSSYRRVALAALGFATFSGGRTELEDVDLCLKAKRAGYHMIVVPAARVVHNESPASRETEFLVGKKQAMNRREIYRRYGLKGPRGRLWFVWASAGWILRQLLILRWRAAAGGIAGLFA